MTRRRKSFSMVTAWCGHRHLADEAMVSRSLADVVDRLQSSDLRATQGGGARPFPAVVGLGSVAIGADTLVAELFRDREIPFIVRLPLSVDRFEADAAPEQRSRIANLITAARHVSVAPRQPTDEDAFLDSGVAMLERADVLIAVWDGLPARGPGGSGDIVNFAHELEVPIIRVDPTTGVVTWPDSDMFQVAPAFAGKTPRLRSRQDVQQAFVEFDESATKHSTDTRLVLFWVILLHLIAPAIAISVAIVLHESEVGERVAQLSSKVAGVLKVGALVGSLGIAAAFRPRHREWLDARTAAELCRSFLAIWTMRRDVISLPPAPTLASEPLQRELELAWILDAPASDDVAACKKAYLSGTAPDDPTNLAGRVHGQRKYFAREEFRAAKWGHRLERAAKSTTLAAIAVGVLSLILTWCHKHGDFYNAVKVASIVLPLVTAAMLAYATARDFTRRTSRFREMRERLDSVSHRIAAAKTWPALGRAVTEAEWLLQGELGEWNAFARHAGELHS